MRNSFFPTKYKNQRYYTFKNTLIRVYFIKKIVVNCPCIREVENLVKLNPMHNMVKTQMLKPLGSVDFTGFVKSTGFRSTWHLTP
jgi:hypothetical protein